MKLLRPLAFIALGFVMTACHLVPSENVIDGEQALAIENINVEEVVNDEQWCAFELSERDIATYLSVAHEVDAQEYNAEAVIAPCRYEGSATIASEKRQWRVYAGGAGYLYSVANDAVDKWYLCKQECRAALPNLQ